MEVLSYVVGILGLFFWVASIQWKEKSKILKSQIIASIFFAIQYFLIGAMTAAYMNLVSTVRAYIYDKQEEKKSVYSLLIFISIVLIIGGISCKDWLNCIPIVASIVYSYITWQKKTKVIRIGFLIAGFLLLYFNYRVGAYVSFIGNIFEIISSIISIYRLDMVKSEKNIGLQ